MDRSAITQATVISFTAILVVLIVDNPANPRAFVLYGLGLYAFLMAVALVSSTLIRRHEARRGDRR